MTGGGQPMTNINCKICGTPCNFICNKSGRLFPDRKFTLYHCPRCGFYFVSNPCCEYDRIYDKNYYHGEGADPLIDYFYEIEHPENTIRHFEYRGILSIINNLVKNNKKTEWLDMGCGMGGLIQYARAHSSYSVQGYDTGYGATYAAEHGIPVISEDELKKSQDRFDIITSVETLEHVEDPRDFIQLVARCLKPGGYFFFTTGNSEPFSRTICTWNYFIPEIHVSLFCEKSIATLFEMSGLEYIGLSDSEREGYIEIYKYKILKNLKVKNDHFVLRFIPWKIVFGYIDSRYKLSWGIGRKRG